MKKETEWACLQPLPPAPSRENGILTIWPWNIRKAPHWFPKKTVFYPEGDVSLDFISYHPYQTEGVAAGTPVLPVSVQIDQSNEKNRAQSDFLVAKAQGITSKTKSVTLEFQHKLSKLAISLTPDASNSANDLLKANPRIIATGLKTYGRL